MAFSYLNAFDLLGDDETDDVNVLCTRLEEKTKKKIADDLPTSPRRTRKQYVVVAPKNSDQLVYEDDISVKGNGASKTTDVGPTDANRRGDVAENGTWQSVSKKVKGRGRSEYGRVKKVKGRGRSEYQRVENGEVKEGESVCDGTNGADVVDQTAANSEGAAGAVIVESSNAEEVGEKEATEEVNGEVAQTTEEIVEETAEERNERERWEKEEERRRIRKEEEAEEAKKMTLAQYEKILSEKKQALKLQRAEVKRVVAADKELESMLLLSKKQEKEEVNASRPVKPTSEAKLKKSESIEKKGRNPLVAELSEISKIFKPASFRGSNGGERGRGIARGGRLGSRDRVNSDRPQISNGPSSDMVHAAPIKRDDKYIPPELRKNQFPALGSVPSEPTAEPSEPTAEPSEPTAEPSEPTAEPSEPTAEPSVPAAAAAKPSAPNGSSTAPAAAAKPSAPNGSSNGANHSEPSKKHYGSRGNRSGSRPYRGGYAGNRYYSSSAGNRTSAATQSAPAAKSSARTEH